MSRENVEIVRDWVEKVLLADDVTDLGDLSFLDPEIVYEDEILPDHVGETYRGREGFRRAWRRALEPWESVEGRLEWVREAGEVVVSRHYKVLPGSGRGARSRRATGVARYCAGDVAGEHRDRPGHLSILQRR